MPMEAEEARRTLARRIVEAITAGTIRNRSELDAEKRRLAGELKLGQLPSSPYILSTALPSERDRVLPLLLLKPTRTASGVAVVAVHTSPKQTCPGSCTFCPDFPEASKSYTGNEPASMRAIQCGYDPYKQVRSRLDQLASMGHPISKVDLIIQGATFPAMDLEYRRWFVARCLDAMANGGSGPRTLSAAIRLAEASEARPVGITCETRPDWFDGRQAEEIMAMGVTRIEIGVQTLSEKVYSLTGRGHGVPDVARAFLVARERGLKICAHMMLALPGSGPKTDLASFRKLFEDPRFKPDEVKIYPTLVIEGSELHRAWQRGEYRALTDSDVLEELIKVKSMVPPWVRVKRVMRDIPSRMVVAGPRASDMRVRVQHAMKSRGSACSCIRCREAGRAERPPGESSLRERSYDVTGGQERFLSIEDGEGILSGFARLSIRQRGDCFLRELHTYGPSVPVGSTPTDGAIQHRGLGEALLSEAERMSEDSGFEKLLVTSGIGARGYYRRRGYYLADPYMVKSL